MQVRRSHSMLICSLMAASHSLAKVLTRANEALASEPALLVEARTGATCGSDGQGAVGELQFNEQVTMGRPGGQQWQARLGRRAGAALEESGLTQGEGPSGAEGALRTRHPRCAWNGQIST